MRETVFELSKTLHLSDDDIRVYLAALELGQTSMVDLARKSGMNRTTLYRHIDVLQERGLMTEIHKRRRKFYSAVHPRQVVEVTREVTRTLERLTPELLAIYNESKTKPRVTFYEGLDGLKEIFADILQERRPMIGWSDYEYSRRAMGQYYETFAEERARRNILYRVIARDTAAARERAQLSRRHLREIKLTTSGDLTTEIYVYGNKVVHLSFRSNPIFAVMIEDPSIAATMRLIWQDAWNKLPEAIVPTEATENVD